MKWVSEFNKQIKKDESKINNWILELSNDKKIIRREKEGYRCIIKTFKKATYAGVKQISSRLDKEYANQRIVNYMFCGICLHGKGFIGYDYRPCVIIFFEDHATVMYSMAKRTSAMLLGFLIAAIRELNPKIVKFDIPYDELFNIEYTTSKWAHFTKVHGVIDYQEKYHICMSGLSIYFDQIKDNYKKRTTFQ